MFELLPRRPIYFGIPGLDKGLAYLSQHTKAVSRLVVPSFTAQYPQLLICVNITKPGLNDFTLALLTLSRKFSFLDNHVQCIYQNICYKILAAIY